MPTPVESADLLMRLYELRREPELRAAREWLLHRWHPASAEEALAMWMGPESARYRMVTTYWEMAAAFVQRGAIDAAMFHAVNTEHVALIAKLGPFLPELRRLAGVPDYLAELEALVLAMPDAESKLTAFRRYLKLKQKQGTGGGGGGGTPSSPPPPPPAPEPHR